MFGVRMVAVSGWWRCLDGGGVRCLNGGLWLEVPSKLDHVNVSGTVVVIAKSFKYLVDMTVTTGGRHYVLLVGVIIGRTCRQKSLEVLEVVVS